MKSKDAYSLGLGVLSGAALNSDSSQSPSNPGRGYPTITVQVNNQSIAGDTNYSVPYAFPDGFLSIPEDGTYGVLLNLHAGTFSPIVIGGVPAWDNLYTISGLQKGEKVIYNRNYSLQANLNGLHAKLAAIEETATMLWGENIVKVLLDIISYLQTSNTVLINLINYYNEHTHGDPPGPGLSSGTNDPDTLPFPPALTQDKTDLQGGKGYINDDGGPM